MSAKHILMFLFPSCFTVCLCGSSQVGLPGCEVEVQIRRGTVRHASPKELVEVKCPVQHCGQAVHIVWCKMLDTNICTNLNNSEHIQINETLLSDERLESVLRFKRISAKDSGLYFCKEMRHGRVGHFINVTVSETNQGEQKNDENLRDEDEMKKNSDESGNAPTDPNNPKDDEMKTSSFLYFVIFPCLVLVLLTITLVILLRTHGRGFSHHQPTHEEQLPSHMIPGLPMRNPPPVVYDTLSISGAVPPPPLPEKTTRDQLSANATAFQSSKSAVYSEVDRTKSQKQKGFQSSSLGHETNQANVISVVVASAESVMETKI